MFANPYKKRKINEEWLNDGHPIAGANADGPTMKSVDNTNRSRQQKCHDAIPQTEDVLINLKVDLLQLYQPQPQLLSLVRNRLCDTCQGCGQYACAKFDVNSNTKTEPNAPPAATNCARCFGRGVFPDEKQFTFSIQGHAHNDRIIFKGEADQKPGHRPGDIVVILNQIPDTHFQREGQHLFIKKEILLVQALCGGEFYIQHLDGKILKFSTRPGEVLSPYQIKCIPNQGMPYKDNVNRRGHIFVQFEVQFPPHPCSPHLMNVLQRFLPAAPPDPLELIVKQQPNQLLNCEIVDPAYPRPNNHKT